MTLEEARKRQREYLTTKGYQERSDGWWVGKCDAAMPLTDEIDNGKFVAGDDVQSDLMIRFVTFEQLPDLD